MIKGLKELAKKGLDQISLELGLSISANLSPFAKRLRLVDRMTVDVSAKDDPGVKGGRMSLQDPMCLSTRLRTAGLGSHGAVASRVKGSSRHGRRAKRMIVMLAGHALLYP